MNALSLFLKFLPSFMPLIAYILIESLFGERAGILAGITLGTAEFVIYRVKDGKFDFFILLDTLLLVLLGGISILLSNPVFYKMKPAVIELLFVIPMAVSSLGGGTWLMKQMTRSVPGFEWNDAMKKSFMRSARLLTLTFLAHAVITLIAAFAWSEAAWAFVSSGLFFIMASAVIGIETLRNRKNARKPRSLPVTTEEILPVVREDGTITGSAPRSTCHAGGTKPLHPVIHVHILNKSGQILLQQRARDKLVEPGKWDTAVGGHIAAGESAETAIAREMKEELGIEGIRVLPVTRYVWETEIERELVFVNVGGLAKAPKVSNDEVTETRFFGRMEIAAMDSFLTPNLRHELDTILTQGLANKAIKELFK